MPVSVADAREIERQWKRHAQHGTPRHRGHAVRFTQDGVATEGYLQDVIYISPLQAQQANLAGQAHVLNLLLHLPHLVGPIAWSMGAIQAEPQALVGTAPPGGALKPWRIDLLGRTPASPLRVVLLPLAADGRVLVDERHGKGPRLFATALRNGTDGDPWATQPVLLTEAVQAASARILGLPREGPNGRAIPLPGMPDIALEAKLVIDDLDRSGEDTQWMEVPDGPVYRRLLVIRVPVEEAWLALPDRRLVAPAELRPQLGSAQDRFWLDKTLGASAAATPAADATARA